MKVLKHVIIVIVLFFAAGTGFMSCKRGGKLEQISVTPATTVIATGTTQQFYSQAFFSNGDVYDWTATTTWSSSDDTAASLSNTLGIYGLVTSSVTGTFIITATDTANSISGTATLTVKYPISISITPVNPFMAVSTSHQFSTTALLEDVVSGGTATITQDLTSSPTLSWSVSDPTIVTISSTGLVTTGTTTGTPTITAVYLFSSTTLTATTTLTITDTALASIAVSPTTSLISLSTTTQQQFAAQGTFADTSKTPPGLTSSWIWSSSNTGVATISNTAGSYGLATAGTTTNTQTTITATDPITGISGNAALTVNP
jgi:hypothetical protein